MANDPRLKKRGEGLEKSQGPASASLSDGLEAQNESLRAVDAAGGPLEPTGSRLENGLCKIISARPLTQELEPPPDGGALAWAQVGLGHLVIFSTWGYISSFGVFQTYYTEALDRSPSDISWVGSTQLWLLFFIGTVSGRATDAGLFRPVFILGAVLQLTGLFMTSLCTEYWQLLLAQGICTGLGNGLQFCPTIALVTTYFSRKRALGLGIVACGSATGGLVYPAIVRQLLPKIGFPWTMRVLGFLTLGIFSLTATFLRTRLPPRKAGPLVEWSALREPPYILYNIGTFLCFWSIYFAFYYIGSFGADSIGASYSDSVSLLLVMNGVGLPGRLVPNFLSDRVSGPLNAIVPYAFCCSALFFGWAGVDSRPGLYAFSAIYGLFAAGVQSLFPVALASLTTDLKRQGTRIGMGFSIVSIAVLTGPPLAGALVQLESGGYVNAQMWGGALMFCGGLALMGARVATTGFKLRVRA